MCKRICMMTTGHPFTDNRIYNKEIKYLADLGYEIVFVGYGDEFPVEEKNIELVRLKTKPNNRVERWIWALSFYRQINNIDADIFHFHDPELLWSGYCLKKKGKRVVYDAHEDLPKQVLSKDYMSKPLKTFLAKVLGFCEKKLACNLDGIIAATESIEKKLLKYNKNTKGAYNYPSLKEYSSCIENRNRKAYCYIGVITEVRGIKEVIKSTRYSGYKLIICGQFESMELFNEVSSFEEWKNVDYRGQLNRNELDKVLAECAVGIVTFYPEPNHVDAMPNKLYEYMACNMAVVASNFPSWITMIDNKLGICVNPRDEKEIGCAVKRIIDNQLWENMGLEGRKLIETQCNWESQIKNIVDLYETIL